MKQAIITGLKKELLLAEISGDPSFEFQSIKNYFKIEQVYGKLTDIKEKQFEDMVNKLMTGQHFQNYNWQGAVIDRWINTAKESFFSKLEAYGIYFENKTKKPSVNESIGTYDLSLKLDAYYKAESEVWDINRTYLFQIL